MEYLLQQLGDSIVIVLIAACFIVGMILKSLTRLTVGISRERSRREIAAYVAEGTITPEHGERIMRAGTSAT